jgi:endoglucanase Acf2
LGNSSSHDVAGQEMTFDEKQTGATPIEIVDYLRGVIDTLRAEKALLEKRYKDLEASRETWQKLAQAWEWLADNKRIVPADEA